MPEVKADGGAPSIRSAFICTTRVVFGEDAVLPEAAGAENVVALVDPGVAASPVGQELLTGLRSVGEVFTEIEPNPSWSSVDAIAATVDPGALDVVFVVGGGSTIDTGKALLSRIRPHRPRLVAVPTTAGTGSEVSAHAIITASDGRKEVMYDPDLRPDVAVLVPALVTTAPVGVRRAAGLDALTHAIESLVSTRSNALTRVLSLSAARLVTAHLPGLLKVQPSTSDAEAVQNAACMAGIAMGTAGLGVCHALGNPLTRLRGIAHGDAVSAFLPVALSRITAPNPGLEELSALLGGPADEEVGSFLDRHGLPTEALGLAGLDEDDVESFQQEALANPANDTYPADVDPDMVRSAVEAAATARRR